MSDRYSSLSSPRSILSSASRSRFKGWFGARAPAIDNEVDTLNGIKEILGYPAGKAGRDWMDAHDVRLDQIGIWTEIKLSVIRDYVAPYSAILKKQADIREFAYIDGFAGAGEHISKTTGEVVPESPVIALEHGFDRYHFVDLDGNRAAHLQQLASGHANVCVYQGDCSAVLLEEVFPQCGYQDHHRALCLLDPYDLNPKWEVVQTAGEMKSVEIFLNFMIMHANRNVLHRAGPADASPTEV